MKFVEIHQVVETLVLKRWLNRDFIKFMDVIPTGHTALTIVGTGELIYVTEKPDYFENACHEDVQKMSIQVHENVQLTSVLR